MKLLTKTTLYFVTISLFIYFILGIGIYQLVKRLENHKVNQELTGQSMRISRDLENLGNDMRDVTIISGGLFQMYHVPAKTEPEFQFSDTLIFEQSLNNFVPYRRLSYYTTVEGVLYKMAIYKSLYESNVVIERVALIILLAIVLFLLTVFFLYRYSFGHLWSEFFESIRMIERFDLNQPGKVDFPKSMIIEFNQLNTVLKRMMDRIGSDFQGMKDFTGNLTHEIQTPLAIIRSKTDLMLQDTNCTENQMIMAGEIKAETMRLSKLVKALGLLSKLDHSQFAGKEKIDLAKLIDEKLESLEDFVRMKNLTITKSAIAKPELEMNPELAEILFGNLVKNAIRHNIKGGTIELSTGQNTFSIKNTGPVLDFDPNVLFNRFVKFSTTSESLGIGLSIVKKICDYYHFKIVYKQVKEFHHISITFKKTEHEYRKN
jgi:signal transduction histidine kinase